MKHSVDVIGEGLFCEEDTVGDFVAFDDWLAALNEFFIEIFSKLIILKYSGALST